ncbi:MAG: deoxyribodipyrimidine photo-lyase [Candidatus Geothermincolales bacterium]
MDSRVEKERVKVLRGGSPAPGDYVLYWMQASQRAEFNPSLEYAIDAANQLRKPLLVFFGLNERYPGANYRHFAFMLEGMAETWSSLRERGIPLLAWKDEPPSGALRLAERACLLVVDRGYLRHQVAWRRALADRSPCPVIQVEGDVVVPVETAYPGEAYSAAPLRRRVREAMPRFLRDIGEGEVKIKGFDPGLEGMDLSDPGAVLSQLDLAPLPPPVSGPVGGTSEAKAHLETFLHHKIDLYPDLSRHPELDFTSRLSPYLHFGQISPVQVALKVLDTGSPGADAFLEQLVIRRELSINLVTYNPRYDSFEALPRWAKNTLDRHRRDRRPQIYSLEELEGARTHDPLWNAAQKEMVATGYMHNYMRMYWGKKILEWTPEPEEALRRIIHLNDRYQLDGRDPNGYAGALWCLGKHDRPFAEREVFGTVRYMGESGLRRKFDMESYRKRAEMAYDAWMSRMVGQNRS